MPRIKIIRHSERVDHANPLYWMICFGHTWFDSPLTSRGHTMAKDKGQQLIEPGFNPLYIYTSPYNRTIATATEIKSSFPHTQIMIEPLLAEYQPWWQHTIDLYPEGVPTSYDGTETDFTYPESYEQFERRIQFIVSKLINKTDGDFIIMTHGEVLKTYTGYIQRLYPDLMLNIGSAPYLTTLSFDYDMVNQRITEASVRIN